VSETQSAGLAVRRKASNVLLIESDDAAAGWERHFLIASDIHFDNPHCDRTLLRAHLDQAMERQAGIILLGDTLDLMQGRDDPRRDGASMKAEYLIDYLDQVLIDAQAFLSPYASNILMVSEGNHESAVRKRLGTNPTKRLAAALGVEAMPYSGWMLFRFLSGEAEKRTRSAFRCYYHHGSGGGGAVTRGVIDTNRRSAMIDGAHIFLSGHIHEAWQMWIPKAGVTSQGHTYTYDQLHVSSATYKDEWAAGEGYHIEKGRPPKPLGGTWLRFWYDTLARNRIRYDASRA
jgi:hypothetical protein